MIITRTPLRLSFFGGGTDYPDYFRSHGGQTLATAIDKYVYVTVHPLSHHFDHRVKVHYSEVETVKNLDDVRIPNVREALRLMGIEGGIEVHLVGDLPARTGLGSSSASTVGLLKALHGHLGRVVDATGLARHAVRVEQEMVGERVGCQDQYIAACGGFMHFTFCPDGEVRTEPVPVSAGRLRDLKDRLLLVYTGLQRTAHEVVEEQLQRTRAGDLHRQLTAMRDQVAKAVEVLTSGRPLKELGEMLDKTWQLKRSLSGRVSNHTVDDIYTRARNAGAVGGKLLGAGGGGFLLLFVEPEDRITVKKAVGEIREVEFDFEPAGSSVIYYHPAA